MSDNVSRKGILNNSRKQADFLKRLGSPQGDDHTKKFIAACNAEMLVSFIKITNRSEHNRVIEYEISLPESEGEAAKLQEERDEANKEWETALEVCNQVGRERDAFRRERDELRAENERLREALRFYADKPCIQAVDTGWNVGYIARKTLSEKGREADV